MMVAVIIIMLVISFIIYRALHPRCFRCGYRSHYELADYYFCRRCGYKTVK